MTIQEAVNWIRFTMSWQEGIKRIIAKMDQEDGNDNQDGVGLRQTRTKDEKVYYLPEGARGENYVSGHQDT